LPSGSKEEDAIIEVFRKRWGHVSAERVLSGAGRVNLYQALCTIDGSAARALTPADVTRNDIGGTDLQCVRAFSHFYAFLGSVAGDPALTFGATGVIYIAGGILPRFEEAFASSPFRERFERKGRFAGMLAKIPTCLILIESPALLGHWQVRRIFHMGGSISCVSEVVGAVLGYEAIEQGSGPAARLLRHFPRRHFGAASSAWRTPRL
jgi:glucokinase